MNIERVTIGEIARVKGGKRLPKGYAVQDEPTDHPYLRVVDFDENGLNPSNVKFISNEVHEKIRRYAITDKDIFVSIAGTIGRVGIVPGSFSGANLTENAAKITDVHESVFGPFLYYFLRGYEGQAILKSKAGGTSQPKLALYRLAEVEFPKPPLETQRRIAWILANYDHLIENNRRRIELLEQAAREIYREWFVRLRFPGHEHTDIVDGVPEGWERVSFAELADFINGYAFKPAHLGEAGLPIVKIPELKNGITAKTPRNPGDLIPSKYHIQDGDLLYSWSGTLAVNVWTSGDALLNQHLFLVIPTGRVGRAFLMFALRESQASFENQTVGATMKHIRRSALNAVSVVIPDSRVLRDFEHTLAGVWNQVINLYKQNNELAAARDLLLPRLMNGMIAV